MKRFESKSKQNVNKYFSDNSLLVIAHPDDEIIFFGPTIMNLLKRDKSLLILCLSSGSEFDDSKSNRRKEIEAVVEALGDNVKLSVIQDDYLKDSMSVVWETSRIVEYIENEIYKAMKSSTPIGTLISFDSYGVSGHVNHQSIYNATLSMSERLKNLKINQVLLTSVPLWRKYSAFLDSIMTYILREAGTFTLAIDLEKYNQLRSLLKLHASQMVWFRELYSIFSRYMFINDLYIP